PLHPFPTRRSSDLAAGRRPDRLRAGTALRRRLSDPTGLLPGPHQAELVPVGIEQDRPVGAPRGPGVPRRPERQQAVELGVPLAVASGSDVEMQPVLADLGDVGPATPGDERTAAVRGADRRLLALVPDQRPAQCVAPEAPDLARAVTGQRAHPPAAREEGVPGFDQAELV